MNTKLTLVLIFVVCFVRAQDIKQINVEIPDTNFKTALVSNKLINTNGDTEISYLEALAYKGSIDVFGKSIANLTGIEYFVNITELDCGFNNLNTLDISSNKALIRLNCSNNNLKSLDIFQNTKLKELHCASNCLNKLYVYVNKELTHLDCSDNVLNNIYISRNSVLEELHCIDNKLATLDISKNIALTTLVCNYNTLNITKNKY